MDSPPKWYPVMTKQLQSHRVSRGHANREDLRQEVALRLFRKYGYRRVDPRVIATAIKNAATDLKRKEKRQFATAGLAADPPEHTKLTRSPRSVKDADDLLISLSELPTSMRSVLEMNLLYQFSYREISEQLGISISTVKRRIRQARQTLHQIHFSRSLA